MPDVAELVTFAAPVAIGGVVEGTLKVVVVSTPAIAHVEVDHAELPIELDARIQ